MEGAGSLNSAVGAQKRATAMWLPSCVHGGQEEEREAERNSRACEPAALPSPVVVQGTAELHNRTSGLCSDGASLNS